VLVLLFFELPPAGAISQVPFTAIVPAPQLTAAGAEVSGVAVCVEPPFASPVADTEAVVVAVASALRPSELPQPAMPTLKAPTAVNLTHNGTGLLFFKAVTRSDIFSLFLNKIL
jgi:hypothetical protein